MEEDFILEPIRNFRLRSSMDAAPKNHLPFGLPTDFKPIAVKSIYFDSQSALSGVSSYSP